MKLISRLQSQQLLRICTSAFLIHYLRAWKYLKFLSKAFGRKEEELRPPLNSTFHKLLLKTLPNFTITATNITTQRPTARVCRKGRSLFPWGVDITHTASSARRIHPTLFKLRGWENTVRSAFMRLQLKVLMTTKLMKMK